MRGKLERSSRRRRALRITAAFLVVITIGWLLPRVYGFVANAVMYPVHTVNSWLETSTGFVPTLVRSRLALEEEIANLENELAVAGNADLTKQRLVAENNRLRQLLDADGIVRIAAAVVARPNELPYDVLQIDRGSMHGIKVGAPVFVGEDIVIGLVVYTGSNYAFVQLVTTPGFEATAFIAGPNVTAALQGVGGGVARVRVPQGVPIRVGDLVHLPSVEPGVFGRISHVESLPTQPEQYGYITPELSIARLHLVAVGQQSQLSQSPEVIEERIANEMKQMLLIPGVVATTSVATTSTSTTLEI